jgi:predicted esterase
VTACGGSRSSVVRFNSIAATGFPHLASEIGGSQFQPKWEPKIMNAKLTVLTATVSLAALATAIGQQPGITPTASLQHQAAHIGTTASFTVTATGTAPLSYQWWRDGTALPDQTNRTITFNTVQPGDEGDYTVEVRNAAGTVSSEPARLWVVPSPSAYIRDDFTTGSFRYPFYYFLPANYNPQRMYPLVCFFHGYYGDETSFINFYGNYAANKEFASYRQQERDPAIVVWPTLRAGQSTPWPVAYVRQTTNLLDNLISRFSVDTNRIYLVGISDGVAPAWDLSGLRPGFFAGAMLLVGGAGSTPASTIKDVPIWAFCARDDYSSLWPVQSLVRSLRLAGGNPLYTEFLTGGHVDGCLMGMSTPAAVEWLLAQRRGAASTNEPLLTVSSPTLQPVVFTGATNLSLAGSASALGRSVTQVAWTNFANNARGLASGTSAWAVTGIPLSTNKTNVVVVTATTTSWAPAYGGSTSFNDTLIVIQSPIRVTLALRGTNALLDWTGGGPPYRVQWTTNLVAGDWVDFPESTPPLTLPSDTAAGFYRIVGH